MQGPSTTLWTVYLLHILLSWCKRLAKLGEYHPILLAWRRFCLPSDSDKVLVVVKLTLYSTLASVMAVIDELVTITAVILATPIPLVNFPDSIFPDFYAVDLGRRAISRILERELGISIEGSQESWGSEVQALSD